MLGFECFGGFGVFCLFVILAAFIVWFKFVLQLVMVVGNLGGCLLLFVLFGCLVINTVVYWLVLICV